MSEELARWSYRVIEFTEPDGSKVRAIHEVHYGADGKPRAYSENPAAVMWDVRGQPKQETLESMGILARMQHALGKPSLTPQDFPDGGVNRRAVPDLSERVAELELRQAESWTLLDECAAALADAALTEDGVDGDRALMLADTIGKRAAFDGIVSAWDAYEHVCEAFRETMGLSEDDEFDLVAELRARIRRLASAEYELTTLRTKAEVLDPVRSAAIGLMQKLEVIFASDEYKGVFAVAMVHGSHYTGVNCEAEMKELADALKATASLPPGPEPPK